MVFTRLFCEPRFDDAADARIHSHLGWGVRAKTRPKIPFLFVVGNEVIRGSIIKRPRHVKVSNFKMKEDLDENLRDDLLVPSGLLGRGPSIRLSHHHHDATAT